MSDNTQKWISVKDRLPEPYEDVLTLDSMGFCFVDFVSKNGKFDGDNESETNPVLYWMPLPEPPKEEP